MKKLINIAVCMVVAGVIAEVALASGPRTEKSVHLTARNPVTAFSVRSSQPKKIVLYVGSTKVATTTMCVKGTTVSTVSRSFATDGTRNMLWHIRGRQDVCTVSVSAALRGRAGYVSVDVYR